MTVAAPVETSTDWLWDLSPLIGDVGRVLGERPVSLALERTHFPGSRPVQAVLSARFADGRCKTVFAEHCPGAPHDHADRIRASLAKSRNGQKPGLDASAVIVAPGAGLVLRRPGLDERLPGLRLLYDPDFARAALGKALGRETGPLAVELVAHRLGKRAVLRVSGPDTEVYVRLRSIKSGDGDARLARHRALWRSLAGHTALRIPEPLAALPEIGAAVFGVLPGAPADFQTADARAVAGAIAALQRLDPEGLPAHSGEDEAHLLAGWLERCRRARPAVARRIAPGLARRMAALKAATTLPSPCHRDLHEKQVLIADGVAGLLDFDTLCLSDPALDAGNLLAHLYLAGEDETRLRGELACAGLGLWRSAALYRLAMIYAFTAMSDAALARLIEEADCDVDD